MEVFTSKIRTDAKGVISTDHALTLSTLVEVNMAKQSLPKSNSKIKICSVDGCGRGGKLTRRLCAKHYQRYRVHGTPVGLNKLDRGASLYERFWSRVEPNQAIDVCWIWQGTIHRKYGVLTFQGKYLRAHRASWMLHNGRESKLLILHSCDNPPCVNPHHLREGTDRDNNQDQIQRGRAIFQTDYVQWHAKIAAAAKRLRKLTDEQASEVRDRYARGESQSSLGRAFGVHQSVVRRLVMGHTYKTPRSDE
jgi:hypothetical protein